MSIEQDNIDTFPRASPYNELPRLPPRVDLETKPVLKRCVEARAALATLDQAATYLPDQGILIATLPLLEAQASSEIENVITTSDRLFQFVEAEARADPPTKETLRYRHALLTGVESIRSKPLCTRTSIEVCSRILGTAVDVRHGPAALSNARTGEVVYTPPSGESLLRDLLANWERFLHDDAGGLDPLVQLAVGHYQFEAIHPFVDGNGRTGRILNSLYLIDRGLLQLPILYLSKHMITNRAQYYEALLNVTTKQAWEPWILYMLEGIEDTARWTARKVNAIRQLADHTANYVRLRAPKVYSHELITAIFEQPYCRIQKLAELGIAKRQTGSRYLKTLSELGVLETREIGRDKLFVHTKLMNLLSSESHEVLPYG